MLPIDENGIDSNGYMTYLHQDAFCDFRLLEPKPLSHLTKSCPICKGFGGWVAKKDAYGLGKHFRAGCFHCNGHGYVREDDNCNNHDWIHTRKLGNCYNEFVCKGCGKKRNVDSSD